MKIKDIIQATKDNSLFIWNYYNGADYGYYKVDTIESYLLDAEVIKVDPMRFNDNKDICLSIAIDL